ncbi:EthD family reductase [Sandarakinorhabdus rubra]|uniref:EthD family reductase n=1 Tax=Sandarakinorhabdus rubra TaxID=2672568 RepID=UPI0013DBEEE5|nr:EthD family reductase [Sandarakinorhabdus rubra]
MAKLVVTYPAQPGATFDRDYYVKVHLPLAQKHFGPAGMTGSEALFPLAPDAAFVCVGILHFRDPAAIGAAMAAPGAGEVMADVAKFTNIQPTATAMA